MPDSSDRLQSALADRYAIERELGAGGMATVYLAADLKHDRKVAIKVLRPELAAVLGAERFVQEIKTTASLQHPHILPLHDSGEADGFLYYVMPYVEGETLRDKLDRETQLGIDEAMKITTEVADALDYAHRQNVIHRDIKPENILLHDGRPMVADFGIALAVSAAAGGRMTETGLSLGTPHYMSPEQATAQKEISGRSDIYSLGVILYEMLAGDPPHIGGTAQQIISKIVTEDVPPVTRTRKSVPPNVAAAVTKALEKLPADRFPTATAFAEALENAAFTFRGPALHTTAEERSARQRLVWPAVAGAAIILALWGWLGGSSPSPGTTGVIHAAIPLTMDQQLYFMSARAYPIDVSQDGRRVVYVGWGEGGTQLYVRDLDTPDARALPGTANARQPFFSPDGEWIAFFAAGELKKVSLAGGTPFHLASLDGMALGGDWGPEGTIIYSVGGSGAFHVSAEGGEPKAVPIAATDVSSGGIGSGVFAWPEFLPDGEHVLVSTTDGSLILSLRSGELRPLLPDGFQPRYLWPGYLIYNEGGGTVRAVPFDPERREVTGSPIPALEGVFRPPGSGASSYTVSRTGTLVYVKTSFERALVFVDRSGRQTPLSLQPGAYRWPLFSPDGRFLKVTAPDLLIVDLRRSVERRVPNVGSIAYWSPDGQSMAVEGTHLRVLRVFETDEPDTLWTGEKYLFPNYWSADGRYIFFAEIRSETGWDIWSVDMEGDSIPIPLLTRRFNELAPRLSPDGRWLVYMSDESGANEIVATPFPGPGPSVKISRRGGEDPWWSGSGKELFYREGNRIMAVEVQTVPTFELGEARELFAGQYDFHTSPWNWHVTADGERFVMIESDPTTTTQLQVVLNWHDELGAMMER